jgi:hypothetical protein
MEMRLSWPWNRANREKQGSELRKGWAKYGLAFEWKMIGSFPDRVKNCQANA